MDKITCNVNNCSHNNSGTCYANRVNIGGLGAKEECCTCCGSFLNKAHYSTLTNNTNSNGACDCLVCEVETCAHNENKLCKANNISVTGNDVHVYTQTHCSTFKEK